MAGYCWQRVAGKGMSVAIYEDEVAAKGALNVMSLKLGVCPVPGITIGRIESHEVIKHA